MATEVMPATQNPSFQKDGREFRNYVNSSRQERVANFYKINHEKQTLDFVLQMKKDFLPLRRTEMSLWDAILKLDSIVDQSDPDTDSSQIIHNVQTAEVKNLFSTNQREKTETHFLLLVNSKGLALRRV